MIGLGVGIGLQRNFGAGVAAWAQTMFATQWNAIANIKESRTLTGYISTFNHYTGSKPLKTIKLYYPNFFLSSGSTGLATSTGNDLPIVDSSITYNGVTYPVTFSAARNRRITDGTGAWADDIDVLSTFGVASLPVDTKLTIKVKGLLDSTAHSVPACAPRGTGTDSGQQVVFYDPAFVVMGSTDVPGIYTWTYQNGGTSANTAARTSGFTPFVLGVHDSAPDVWLIDGDSISANTGDSGTSTSGTGYAQRAIGAMPVKAAACNISVHGSTALAGINDTRITDLFPYCNLSWSFKGANDIGTSGTGLTPQAMLDRMLARKVKYVAAGITKHIICMTTPRSNSTDGWITEINQTPLSGWDSVSANPILYNGLLATAGYDLVCPFTSIRGTLSVFNIRAGGAFDTTHFNQQGNIWMGGEASPLMQSLMTR